MLKQRLRNSNENGYFDLEGVVISMLGIIVLLVALVALPKIILNTGVGLFGTESVKATQQELKTQGYTLSYASVHDLIKNNDNDFLTEGGEGPEATIMLEDFGEIDAYLLIEKEGSVLTPVLKYSDDDSLVASPKLIPEDTKEKW
jgi:hypothetical protein